MKKTLRRLMGHMEYLANRGESWTPKIKRRYIALRRSLMVNSSRLLTQATANKRSYEEIARGK